MLRPSYGTCFVRLRRLEACAGRRRGRPEIMTLRASMAMTNDCLEVCGLVRQSKLYGKPRIMNLWLYLVNRRIPNGTPFGGVGRAGKSLPSLPDLWGGRCLRDLNSPQGAPRLEAPHDA